MKTLPAKLDVAANVCTIAVCIIVAFVLVNRLIADRSTPAASGPPPLYAQGERMEALPGVNYAASSKTLVMFVRSTCVFCTESMPFYQRLASESKRRQGSFQLVAVGVETPDTIDTYLRAHDVIVDQVVSIQSGTTRLIATPVLLLIDSSRKVIQQWAGKLPAAKEQELLHAL